jgi:hypothetical protein
MMCFATLSADAATDGAMSDLGNECDVFDPTETGLR